MRKIILSLLIVFFILTVPSIVFARSYRSSSSDVYVHGYYRKNGTYVQPHYRSAPDGIISNNYSCIDNGKCGLSGNSVYVPVSIPTPIHIIPPDNPVTKGDVSFTEMSLTPFYTINVRWIDTGHRDYSIALSKYAGVDPGPNTDTTASKFIFNNVKPGRWYINLKSKIGNQWSKITYFSVDIPAWTLPTPTISPSPTSVPTPTVEVSVKPKQEVLSTSSNKSETNIWERIKLIIYTFFKK